jgi:5-methylthioadenosine/S-adenosylhomocysteine deaminase
MLFEKITLIDENLKVKENMYVGVEGDRIDYIGDVAPEKDYGDKICGKNKLLTNGWFNCHTHLPMTLLRGYAEKQPPFLCKTAAIPYPITAVTRIPRLSR